MSKVVATCPSRILEAMKLFTESFPFTSNVFFKILKTALLITCIIFFAFQVQLFFDLYLQNATILGINYQKRSNRPYPSVTFCPQDVVRESGIPINTTEFNRLSFKMVKNYHLNSKTLQQYMLQ